MKKTPPLIFLMISFFVIWFMSGCAPSASEPVPVNTLEADLPLPTDAAHTIAEVEELAGFEVKVPAYLPSGVSLDYATYQKEPEPNVTLHFKLIHETYGDMGAFFQIVQQPQAGATSNTEVCETNDCQTLETGDLRVQYRLSTPTESLIWEAGGFSFRLLRTAGEPNKIYKDELLKVVSSME